MTRSELEIISALTGKKTTIALARLVLTDKEFLHYCESRIPAHHWTDMSKEGWDAWKRQELNRMVEIIDNRQEQVT